MDTVQGEEVERKINIIKRSERSGQVITIWWSWDREGVGFLKIFTFFFGGWTTKLMHAYLKRKKTLKKYIVWQVNIPHTPFSSSP